jgi:hypothetical protein
MENPRKPPPSDLDKGGKALWRGVIHENELGAIEFPLLHQTCRVVDILDDLYREKATMGAIVSGSSGQPRVNPILAEIREQTAILDRLVTALAIPLPGEQYGTRRTGPARAKAKVKRQPQDPRVNRVSHLREGA